MQSILGVPTLKIKQLSLLMLRDSAPSKFAMMYLGKMDAEKFYFLKDTHTKNRKYE